MPVNANARPADWRLPRVDRPRKERVPLPPPTDKYLAGPIPLEWLESAGREAGHALHVGIALWHQARLTGTAVVTPPKAFLDGMGVNRWAVGRALEALEQAGLVSVERAAGRKPVVTLLAAGSTPLAATGFRGNDE